MRVFDSQFSKNEIFETHVYFSIQISKHLPAIDFLMHRYELYRQAYTHTKMNIILLLKKIMLILNLCIYESNLHVICFRQKNQFNSITMVNERVKHNNKTFFKLFEAF